MTGWRWFWTLVGFLASIIILIFLFFYKPFADLFTLVLNGIDYGNDLFWAALLIAVIAFCAFHWRAYRLHIVKERNLETMVLTSLQGSTFIAILLSASATLQAVQILAAHLIQPDYALDAMFGQRLLALIALIVLTGLFCIVFWLLRSIGSGRTLSSAGPSSERA